MSLAVRKVFSSRSDFPHLNTALPASASAGNFLPQLYLKDLIELRFGDSGQRKAPTEKRESGLRRTASVDSLAPAEFGRVLLQASNMKGCWRVGGAPFGELRIICVLSLLLGFITQHPELQYLDALGTLS